MLRDEKEKEIPALKTHDVGGAQLPYLYFGGDDPALKMVFVHATGFLPWLWQPIIEEFVPQNKVWAPFICNYRQCDPEKGGLSWDIIAQDLAGFCRSQAINESFVVGHSMGATVLTIAVARYELRPRGMVLIEPIFLPEKFYTANIALKDHPLASKSIKRKNNWKNEKEALAYMKSRPLFDGWDEQVLQLYIKYGLQKQKEGNLTLTCTPESEAAIFMGGRKDNPWPLLGKINCPVLVVEGEESANRKFVDIKKAVSLLHQGKYRSVAAAGHLIPMQKPKELAYIIKEFCRQIT
jgi:pimeloyl-ACP methyl ester carboxylesterase